MPTNAGVVGLEVQAKEIRTRSRWSVGSPGFTVKLQNGSPDSDIQDPRLNEKLMNYAKYEKLKGPGVLALHWLKILSLIAIVVASASLLVWGKAPPILNVSAQVGSALAGAGFGVLIARKSADESTRNHTRPAVRQLFDQMARLRYLVVASESRAELLRNAEYVDAQRIGDWLDEFGQSMRSEINSCGSAIQNWADLAPDIHEDEWAKYNTREQEKQLQSSGEDQHE